MRTRDDQQLAATGIKKIKTIINNYIKKPAPLKVIRDPEMNIRLKSFYDRKIEKRIIMKNYDNFDFEEFKKKTQEGHLAITTVEEWKGFVRHLAVYSGYSPTSYATPSVGILRDGLGVFWNETGNHAQAYSLDSYEIRATHAIKYTMEDFCSKPFMSTEDELFKFISEV